jgi:hypothetical protein
LSLDIAVSFGGKSLFLLSDCPTVQNQRHRNSVNFALEMRNFSILLDIRKPDKVGLGFYELCAPLSSGGSFLLRTKLHQVEEISSIGVPVSPVVRTSRTTHTMDSYCLDSPGRELLKESGVK